MSTNTMDFIQKICYKKTASVDMTKHGFINDSKLYTVNLLLRPLREKLEKICGKHTENVMLLQENSRKSSPMRKYVIAGAKKKKTRNEVGVKLKNKKPKQKRRVTINSR